MKATRACLLAASIPFLVSAMPPSSRMSSVTVLVEGLRSDRGLVRACMTANPRTFPDCERDPAARHSSVAAAHGERITFDAVPAGRYAIALFHDENANGRLDKVLMVPKEGFGFSRDAPARFGPPRFAAAAWQLDRPEERTAIRVRYLL